MRWPTAIFRRVARPLLATIAPGHFAFGRIRLADDVFAFHRGKSAVTSPWRGRAPVLRALLPGTSQSVIGLRRRRGYVQPCWTHHVVTVVPPETVQARPCLFDRQAGHELISTSRGRSKQFNRRADIARHPQCALRSTMGASLRVCRRISGFA